MSEEKEKEIQEMVWKIPTLDTHSVPQKIDLCQHAQGKHYFQLQMSYFLPKSALSLCILLLDKLFFCIFHEQLSIKPVLHSTS